jgi:hypothetical protein
VLYRVFRSRTGAAVDAPGGPLFVPRDRQGAGRHDDPPRYGAFYAAQTPESAVAEAIQAFRGRDLADGDLAFVDGSQLALAAYDYAVLGPLTDLDDPSVLLAEGWRPSRVASRDRSVTQPMAVAAFESGALGLSWWSTLDAAWTNVTLFAERTVGLGSISLAGPPERLTTRHPVVRAAAANLAIPLARRR